MKLQDSSELVHINLRSLTAGRVVVRGLECEIGLCLLDWTCPNGLSTRMVTRSHFLFCLPLSVQRRSAGVPLQPEKWSFIKCNQPPRRHFFSIKLVRHSF